MILLLCRPQESAWAAEYHSHSLLQLAKPTYSNYHTLHMQLRAPRTLSFWALAIAVIAVSWFSLGSTLNVLAASVLGKKIEMVVCSGAGVKKIYVPVDTEQDSAATVKHCSNAPLFKYLALPSAPSHLNFEPPRTVTVWQWIAKPKTVPGLIEDNKPPPGRGPPSAALA